MQKSGATTGIILGCLIMLILVGGCGGRDVKVLAKVGDLKITTQDFKIALSNLPENYKILTGSYKGKRKILDNLIKKNLLVQEAERRDYHRSPETKKEIKELKAENRRKLKQDIEDLKVRMKVIDRQVYENVMLDELNSRLKKEGLKGVRIADTEIEAYYQDYARKMKIINPAVRVPDLEKVQRQIQAILVEEELLKQLEKKSKVTIQELLFRKIFGDEKDAVIDDNP
ncbi:SurA N-terminal domain-containing protein [bacterium]|nr:SurA N-terminal domain-containing protein [bacterium]